MDTKALRGRVALVAGATRGAGRAIAVELARAGAYVYATGRSSRAAGRSEMDRPETIEDTLALLEAAGGTGQAMRVDHLEAAEVRDLIRRIDETHGRLDILVNDMFGGDRYAEWGKPLWEHDLAGGLRMLRMGVDTHLITLFHALPLLLRGERGVVIEMTDGTEAFNQGYRGSFYYDLVKANVGRMVKNLAAELSAHPVAAVGVTPGWLRSEAMLEQFGVAEENWRDACATTPVFGISESPAYVARGIANLAADQDASRFRGQILTARDLADCYGVTDVDGSRPDVFGLFAAHGQQCEDADIIRSFR